jgi:hypothetical protein
VLLLLTSQSITPYPSHSVAGSSTCVITLDISTRKKTKCRCPGHAAAAATSALVRCARCTVTAACTSCWEESGPSLQVRGGCCYFLCLFLWFMRVCMLVLAAQAAGGYTGHHRRWGLLLLLVMPVVIVHACLYACAGWRPARHNCRWVLLLLLLFSMPVNVNCSCLLI